MRSIYINIRVCVYMYKDTHTEFFFFLVIELYMRITCTDVLVDIAD